MGSTTGRSENGCLESHPSNISTFFTVGQAHSMMVLSFRKTSSSSLCGVKHREGSEFQHRAIRAFPTFSRTITLFPKLSTQTTNNTSSISPSHPATEGSMEYP